jgi:hypothetical protein
MTEKQPFNLFKQNNSSRLTEKPTPPKKSLSPAPSASELSESDLSEMLSKMKDLYDQLNKRFFETCEKFGMDIKHIQEILNNPNNFRPGEWNRIQKQRQDLLAGIWKSLGKEEQARIKKVELEKKGKDRKGKTLGARRQWLPM